MLLDIRLGEQSDLWNPPDHVSISGPDSDFLNGVSEEQPFKFRTVAVVTGLSYSTRSESR